MGSVLRGVVLLVVILAAATLVVTAQSLGETQIRFQSSDGTVTGAFRVDLAYKKADRVQGLKFVKKLGADQGMLFIFPVEKQQSFWMKDTYIPLDMIFVDSEKRVVGIIHEVPPFTKESQKVDAKSVYVVELAGGTARRWGIEVGDKMIVEQPIPEPSSLPAD